MGDRPLAEVFDGEAENHVEHQHVVNNDIIVAQGAGVFAVEIGRVEIHRHAGEQRVVAIVDGPAPMMLEDLANLEVFEVVPPFDFPDCHFSTTVPAFGSYLRVTAKPGQTQSVMLAPPSRRLRAMRSTGQLKPSEGAD